MPRFFVTPFLLVSGVLVLVALGVSLAPNLFSRDAEAGGGSANIAVGSGTVAPGGSITVDLTVTPTSGDVGALDVDINFDSAVLDATSASAPTCNIFFDSDTIRCSLANLAGFNGVASTLTFQAVGASGTASSLQLVISACTDTTGTDITCTPQDGNINVGAPTPTPSPSPSPTPTPAPRLWGDLNCDGTVNAVDSLAIQRWKVNYPVFQVQPCPLIGQPYP